MSSALPVVRHLDRIERGLRDLIAGVRTVHRSLDRHDEAEHSLNAVVPANPEGKPDIPAHHLYVAGVHEELWTAEHVDLPSHFQALPADQRCAATQLDHSLSTTWAGTPRLCQVPDTGRLRVASLRSRLDPDQRASDSTSIARGRAA